MKLNLLLVHPTHYYAFLLKSLQASLQRDVTMEVDYLDEVNSKYPWETNFREGYTSTVFNGSYFRIRMIRKIIRETNSTFIIVGWERLDKLFVIFLLSIFKRKYMVYTDTPNNSKSRTPAKNFIRNSILSYISNNAYGILVTGEIGVKKVNEWSYKFRNVINLPFFVDLSYFKPRTEIAKVIDNHLIFFSSGRLDNSHKGFDLAIKALGVLKQNKKLVNFLYLIAGEGPDRSVLQQLIQENNLDEEVKMLGWVEPGALLLHYQTSHIFLHPSHFDPYPNAVLEAMACGMAVIASDEAGSAIDRVEHGLNGYLFEAGNLNGLIEGISNLITNRTLIKKFGAAARENAEAWPVELGINVINSIIKRN